MLFPIEIKSYIKKGEVCTLRCPKCGAASRFRIIRHGTAISVFGVTVKGLHNNHAAVCTNCGARFNLSGERYRELEKVREESRKNIKLFGKGKLK